MNEMDFLKYFSMSTICSYVDGHDNTTIHVSSSKNQPKLIMIQTEKPMNEINFTLTQLDIKHKKSFDGYTLSYARFVIGRI